MINFIYWNARGVGNKSTTTHLKNLCVLHHPDIVVISETKIHPDRLPLLAKQLDFEKFDHGGETNKDTWILWKPAIMVTILDWGTHQVTFQAKALHANYHIMYTFLHAPCLASDRQVLWDTLADAWGDTTDPWIVAGDFNTISSWEEQSGKDRNDSTSIHSFNHFQRSRCVR